MFYLVSSEKLALWEGSEASRNLSVWGKFGCEKTELYRDAFILEVRIEQDRISSSQNQADLRQGTGWKGAVGCFLSLGLSS